MLRFAADRRTLAMIGFVWAFELAAWAWDPSGVPCAPLVALIAVLSWVCAVIAHNTLHAPVFRGRAANRMFQVVLSLSYGWPVSEYVPGHNKSHHRHLQTRRDLMRTTKVRFRWNLLNAIAFVPRVMVDIFPENMRYIELMRRRRPRWFRQFLLEVVAVWSVKAIALLVDWRRALLFLFIPHLFAVWGITAVNLLQHDGCVDGDPINGSRNFVGAAFNWLTFNNGYHTMHHLQPALHWSLLPAAHLEKVHPRIAPQLEQRSLALYLWRTFIWPGRRQDLAGRPLELPPPAPDLPWFEVGDAT
jgi:fatty acid desaturase